MKATTAGRAGIMAAAALLVAATSAYAAKPGDFDGDGRSDLAIGAGFEDLPSVVGGDHGAATVVRGDLVGLDLGDAQNLGLSQEFAGLAGDGAENGDHFGLRLGSGDFNGDDRVDLVVGVPSESVRGAEGGDGIAGAFHVIYGSDTGLTTVRDDFVTQDEAGLAGDGAEGVDQFGNTLAAGDFDGDGFDDLAAAALDDGPGAGAGGGTITVMNGSRGGLVTAGSRWITPESKGLAGDGEENTDDFGTTLASGDFDGDGRDDLAAGAPGEVLGAEGVAEGAVHVLNGSAKGLTTKGDMLLSQATKGVPDEPQDFERFGWELAAGDFDARGGDDLAIGLREDPTDTVNADGAVHVLFGGAGGLSASGDELLSKHTDGFPPTFSEAGGNFGDELAVGRFDGGRADDLAVAIPNEDASQAIPDSGAVAILFGGGSGFQAAGGALGSEAQLFSQATPGIAGDGAEPSDRFGGGDLAVGDFDGAGRHDLAIGTDTEAVGGAGVAGAVNVLYSFGEGLSVDDDQFFAQGDTGTGTTEAQDRFGGALAP